MPGPYAKAVIAEFLGKRENDIDLLVKEDGLPALNIPAGKKPVHKFTLTGFHNWLKKYSENKPLSLAELEGELDAAHARVKARWDEKKQRAKKKKEALAA